VGRGSGRGSAVVGVADVGIDMPETIRESGLMYLSRWYRLPAGFDILSLPDKESHQNTINGCASVSPDAGTGYGKRVQ
jgi:hypothetical protein